jgi:uncharacterized HAD superfamily protein
VPRSGLFAANLLSLAANIPLTDVDGLIAGRLLATGRTRRRGSFGRHAGELKNILIIDDSISTGGSICEVRDKIAASGIEATFTYCAVFGLEDSHVEVDLVLETVPLPRMFQWNMFHHDLLQFCCVDIDGVLCVDPTEEENDDGPAYEAFLESAVAMHVPTRRIGYLVTSRLEKCRSQTEAWLASAGIEYDELIMLDLPTKEARQKSRAHGSFKADVYRSLNAVLFIESEHAQAQEIARRSGKPVLCIESQQIVTPSPLSPLALVQNARTLPRRLKIAQSPLANTQSFKARLRAVVGDSIYERLKRAARRTGDRKDAASSSD